MYFLLLICFELLLLFFISQRLTKKLSYTLFRYLKSQKVSVYIFSLIFLPGTIFHELAHFFVAKLLFVYAGRIQLLPKLEKHEIKMGTVEIGKTDIFRRFLIGSAPFILGSMTIVLSINYALHYSLFNNYWFLLGILYLIFQIGNSMFSSKKDMEGTLELMLVICVLLLFLYFLGIRISFTELLQNERLIEILQKISLYLAFPILVDLVLLFLLHILTKNSLKYSYKY